MSSNDTLALKALEAAMATLALAHMQISGGVKPPRATPGWLREDLRLPAGDSASGGISSTET